MLPRLPGEPAAASAVDGSDPALPTEVGSGGRTLLTANACGPCARQRDYGGRPVARAFVARYHTERLAAARTPLAVRRVWSGQRGTARLLKSAMVVAMVAFVLSARLP